MDRSRLSSLRRTQLQQLAKRDCLKANLKNVEIIRLLLKKYPDGVPELSDEPSESEGSDSSGKQRSRANGARNPSIKVEESALSVCSESTLEDLDSPREARYARSMAPPPITPTSSFIALRMPEYGRLPKTPLINTVFEQQALQGEKDEVADVRGAGCPPETPVEAAAATSHQVHEMLRDLTDIINTDPLDPEEASSILCRAKALNAILDTTIVPRMMKVDKDVRDLLWMRVALEKHLGPRGEESFPVSRHSGSSCVQPDFSFSAPHSPSRKRPREEEGHEVASPLTHPRASKRTRIQ